MKQDEAELVNEEANDVEVEVHRGRTHDAAVLQNGGDAVAMSLVAHSSGAVPCCRRLVAVE